jgi:hypothetical protein
MQDDDRESYANPDPLLAYNLWKDTYAATTTNFRRNIRVAFNDTLIPAGNSDSYTVVGFGCFFIPEYPDPQPSDAICFTYVGSCDISGKPNSGNEPSLTKIVLFK